MKKTQVNGWYTSSLPLAEFWQPANLPRINAILATHLPELDIEHARKRFECPTNPMYKGKVVGNPSMTDLMILDGLRWKIADEGKFTEYSCGLRMQTCADWLDEYAKRRRVSRTCRQKSLIFRQSVFSAANRRSSDRLRSACC